MTYAVLLVLTQTKRQSWFMYSRKYKYSKQYIVIV